MTPCYNWEAPNENKILLTIFSATNQQMYKLVWYKATIEEHPMKITHSPSLSISGKYNMKQKEISFNAKIKNRKDISFAINKVFFLFTFSAVSLHYNKFKPAGIAIFCLCVWLSLPAKTLHCQRVFLVINWLVYCRKDGHFYKW